MAVSALADLTRTKPELIAENALLRQQLIVLHRSVKRPKITARDRWFFILLARQVRYWKQALLIIQPDTLLRWACDFVQVPDVLFRTLFCFFLIEVGSRKVVHVAVTRHPTEQWVAQQLREATPFGTAPKYLIRDNDSKYGARCLWHRY